MDKELNKTIIRKEVKQVLVKLANTPETKQKMQLELYHKLFQWSGWQSAETIAVTVSMPLELNTLPIIAKAWQQGKNVAIPKTFTKGKMSFFAYQEHDELIKTNFGVSEPATIAKLIEPSEIDLLIVPGVVFNSAGYRIGFGGGFYDRYLANFKGNTCSLVFPEQISPKWQPESHDLPVQTLFML